MDSLDQAIYDIVHNSDIKPKGIADRVALSHQVLLNKANPNCESHHMTVREAHAILLHTGNLAVVNAMQTEFSLYQRKSVPVSVLASVLSAGKEHGDVLATIQAGLEDGKLTEAEKSEIFKEIDETEAALKLLRESVMSHGKDLGISTH